MTLQNLNFEADIRDIFDVNGNRVDPYLGRGVYRKDTDELLSVCGPATQLVQHKDLLTPIFDKFEDMGYALEEKEPDQMLLPQLAGKKGAWVSSEVSHNGAVMRTNIVLGDFINPTGSSVYMDDGPDTNFFRISVLNSHNSKLAARANTDYLRALCMNGQVGLNFSASAYGKHTSGFNLSGMQAQIENAMSMMGEDAERFGQMAKAKLTSKQAVEFLKKTIAKLANKPTGESHFSEPLLNKIMARFHREDQTVWGLYNAATYWSTHGDMKASADNITGRLGREGQVAKMIRSPRFSDLLNA